jgi:anaerobic ribonucleoside-triphosphate reductase
MNEGSNPNIQLIMNILLYAEFGDWLKDDIEGLLEVIAKIYDTEEEPNVPYYLYNPIMTICLCCKILDNIGESQGTYAQTCDET